MTDTLDTRERIQRIAMQLFRDRGFAGVTTKAIAEAADVNEVTIFRHFGTKKRLFASLFEKHSYGSRFRRVMEQVVWDLRDDLMTVGEAYVAYFEQYEDVILICYRNPDLAAEHGVELAVLPRELVHLLTRYFDEMQRMKKITAMDSVATAANFVSLLFGYCFSRAHHKEKLSAGMTDARFLIAYIDSLQAAYRVG